jgi:hypothetical protein
LKAVTRASRQREKEETQSQQWHRFWWVRLPLPPQRPELISVLSYDCGGWLQPNTDGAAFIDKCTLGGNASDDFFWG